VKSPAAGLAANLDKLSSYRFTATIYAATSTDPSVIPGPSDAASGTSSSAASGTSPGNSASVAPSDGASVYIQGTVVNSASRSIRISIGAVQYVVVGSSAWTSVDGEVWALVDNVADVTKLLPAAYYNTWFDPHVSGFAAIGDEMRNGVACTRYSGSDTLGNLYASMTGATLQADLWVARNGSFPVGGRYLVPQAGRTSGFAFEITNVDDPTNVVAMPTNVVPLPS
jgi:hypothetical protein